MPRRSRASSSWRTCWATARMTARLAEDIEKIYDFIQSHADPEGWLDEKEQAYATARPLRSTVWADVVLRHIAGFSGTRKPC